MLGIRAANLGSRTSAGRERTRYALPTTDKSRGGVWGLGAETAWRIGEHDERRADDHAAAVRGWWAWRRGPGDRDRAGRAQPGTGAGRAAQGGLRLRRPG